MIQVLIRQKDSASRRLLTLIVAGLLLACFTIVYAQDVKQAIRTALNSGDTTQAVSLLNAEIKSDPALDVNYFVLGQIHFARGQYPRAAELFKTSVDKRGKNWDALYHLGLTQIQLGDLDKAEKTMDEGRKKVKDGRDKARFENGYGLVMMARKKYNDADRAFRQALIHDSTNAEYYINLGDANFYSGVPALAIGSYEKAMKVDTGSTEVFFHWAEACLETRDYNCAIEKLGIVLSRDSSFAPAWRRAGEIYFKASLGAKSREDRSNRLKDVVGAYRRFFALTAPKDGSSMKADSTNVRPFFELGMAYANLGVSESAAVYLEPVILIPYEPKDIYLTYGKALLGQKLYDSASVMLDKHMEWVKRQGSNYSSTMTDVELYTTLGDAFYNQDPKDYQAAVMYYEKALAKDSTQKALLQKTAFAYHSMKNYSRALVYYDRRIAAGIDSASSAILKNAGIAALAIAGGAPIDEVGDTETSVTNGIDSAAIDPNRNYHRVAADYFAQFLQYNPSDVKTVQLIANLYMNELNDCAGGIAWYEKLKAADPGNCAANKALGYAYLTGQGQCPRNVSRALEYLVDAYQCESSAGRACTDVNLILSIAQSYHLRAADKNTDKAQANTDFKNAYEWYGRVLKCAPNNADAKKGQDDTRFEFN